MENEITIKIKTEFIKLQAAIKFAGVAETGAGAKELIENGLVFVNGESEAEYRRGKKIYPGGVIRIKSGQEIRVIAE